VAPCSEFISSHLDDLDKTRKQVRREINRYFNIETIGSRNSLGAYTSQYKSMMPVFDIDPKNDIFENLVKFIDDHRTGQKTVLKQIRTRKKTKKGKSIGKKKSLIRHSSKKRRKKK